MSIFDKLKRDAYEVRLREVIDLLERCHPEEDERGAIVVTPEIAAFLFESERRLERLRMDATRNL